MSKDIKKLMIDDISAKFKGIKECVVIDISALDSEATFSFRNDMREANIEVRGVKNSLARKAFEGEELESVGGVLKGACAISYSSEDSVSLAKALVKWAKSNDSLVIKGGLTEGNVLDGAGVLALSKMPSRDQLLSTISGQIMGPASQIASQLNAQGGAIAGAIKTLIENKEQSS
jgi:large subunit ribosomal protein L10